MNNNKKGVEGNIWKFYIIKALNWFLLVMPIIVLFYQENGLSMRDLLLLQSVFSIAIISFEVPSGYFSDVFGRRTTLIIGTIIGFIGYLVFSLSYGFWGFLIAEVIMGLGSSFLSGTDSALIYDSLAQLKKKKDYKKIEGRIASIGNFSEGIAALVGGSLALISLRMPLYVQTGVLLFTIPLAFSIVEPVRNKLKNKLGAFRGILKIVRYSMHDHKEIKWLIVYSSVIGCATLTAAWMAQPYFKLVGLPLVFFGVLWAALQFSVGGFALIAYKFEELFGKKKSLIILIILVGIGYICLSLINSLWGIVFIFLLYFVRGINMPIVKDYLNNVITSEIRATVLSVRFLIGRLIFSVLGPSIGWMTDIYSLQFALMVSGLFFFISGIISLIFLEYHKVL